MAFMRSATAMSMVSRGWSTAEFFDGLGQVAEGGHNSLELPDDLAALEDSLWVYSTCMFIIVDLIENKG